MEPFAERTEIGCALKDNQFIEILNRVERVVDAKAVEAEVVGKAAVDFDLRVVEKIFGKRNQLFASVLNIVDGDMPVLRAAAMYELKLEREAFHAPDGRLGVEADVPHIIVVEVSNRFRQGFIRRLIRRSRQVLCPGFKHIEVKAILCGSRECRAHQYDRKKMGFFHVRQNN